MFSYFGQCAGIEPGLFLFCSGHIGPYILKYASEVTRMYVFMALCMCVPAFWLDDFPSMGLLRNFASWMSVVAHSCRQQPKSRSDLSPRWSHGARGQLQKIDGDWWEWHDLADEDTNGQSDSLSAVTSQSTRDNCKLRDSCKQGTQLQIMCCDAMAAILDYCNTLSNHVVSSANQKPYIICQVPGILKNLTRIPKNCSWTCCEFSRIHFIKNGIRILEKVHWGEIKRYRKF